MSNSTRTDTLVMQAIRICEKMNSMRILRLIHILRETIGRDRVGNFFLPFAYPFVPTACVTMRNYSQRAHHAQGMVKIKGRIYDFISIIYEINCIRVDIIPAGSLSKIL
jgi:hypothetical protein